MTPEELSAAESDALWEELSWAVGRHRVELLTELANRASGTGNFAQASGLLNEAASEAIAIPDEVLAGLTEWLWGTALYHQGDYAMSAVVFRIAAQGLASSGHVADAAVALWGRADALRMMGDAQGCLDAATDCRGMAEEEACRELAGDACEQQARALFALDRTDEALTACAAAREHMRSVGKLVRVGQVDDFAMTVHMCRGNWQEAMVLADSCLVLAGQVPGSSEAYARRRRAEVHTLRGEFEFALEELETARAANMALEDFGEVARCDLWRARALKGLGRYKAALPLATAARVLLDATGNDAEALEGLALEATLFHQCGEYSQAEQANHRIIDTLADPVGDSRAQWAVVRIGESRLAAGAYADIEGLVEVSQALWVDRTRDRESLLHLLTLKARALAESGNLAAAAELAEELLAEALLVEPSGSLPALGPYLREIVALKMLEDGDPDARMVLAYAVALHLAVGSPLRAVELSTHFVPGFDGLLPLDSAERADVVDRALAAGSTRRTLV